MSPWRNYPGLVRGFWNLTGCWGRIGPWFRCVVGWGTGVGKSTLLLQAAAAFASMRGPVFYVSGEESFQQLRLRAKRLGVLSDAVQAVNETDVLRVISYAERLQPGLVILDSIQTMVHPEIPGFPGGVSQVRECTTALVKWAKAQQVPCLIVGHITKTGGLAGPKVLEHLVDTVLYFEGDPIRPIACSAPSKIGTAPPMSWPSLKWAIRV